MRGLKDRIDPNLRYLVRWQWHIFRRLGARFFLGWNAMLASAWVRDRANRRHYRILSPDEARAARRSDRVFVFGSGASLNDLTEKEWAHIGEHDTMGFNAFYKQRWVRVDYHALRGAVYVELRWRPHAEEVRREVAESPFFAETIFLLQEEYLAQLGNQLVGYRLLPEGARMLRYRTARLDGPPTRTFADGIRHTHGTLSDAVNLAYLLGWKEIVLVGVDLYDARYFFLPPNETPVPDPETGLIVGGEYSVHGGRFDEAHGTTQLGIVRTMGEWREALARDGVELSVYNPRSLMTEVLPVYRRPAPRYARSAS